MTKIINKRVSRTTEVSSAPGTRQKRIYWAQGSVAHAGGYMGSTVIGTKGGSPNAARKKLQRIAEEIVGS